MVGILLSKATGNEVFGAIGALLIGLLLMGFAAALAWENKRLLLGESLSAGAEADLWDVVGEVPGMVHIDTFRTVFVGAQEILVTADVSFDPELGTHDLDAAIAGIEDRLREADERVRYVFVDPET